MTMNETHKAEFTVWLNEGTFFDEPWLHDEKANKDYRYDEVPPDVRKAFAEYLSKKGRMTPSEARMLLDFIRN